VPPAGGWLLARAASEGTSTSAARATYDLDEERLRAALPRPPPAACSPAARRHDGPHPEGARAVDALADARCAALEDLVADWSPTEHPELHRYVESLSDDLVGSGAARLDSRA
jgi:hypothetical protein